MKRMLLFSFFAGIGLVLYAQNTGSAAKQAVGGDQVSGGTRTISGGQNTSTVNNMNVPPGSLSPNAQVTVTPGPLGLPIVNSSASAWPLGPVLDENLNYWLNGVLQTAENGGGQAANPPSPPVPAPWSQTGNRARPSFQPPPMGGMPSLGAPRPSGRPPAAMGPDLVSPSVQIQGNPPNSPAPAGAPAGQAPGQPVSRGSRQNRRSEAQAPHARTVQASRQGGRVFPVQESVQPGLPAAVWQDAALAGKTIVVIPSPVHYDRAGRRVIDPSWQESLYRSQMILAAEEEVLSPAAEQSPEEAEAQTGKTAEQNGARKESPKAAQGDPPVREIRAPVPSPAVWRIRGTLTAAKGMLALEDSEGVLWYLPGLDHYIGFVDGLEAGEEAALEGYAAPRGSSRERYFQPIRLFIDDAAYDLTISPYGTPAPGPGGQAAAAAGEPERRSGSQSSSERRGKFRAGNRGGPGPENQPGWDDWDDDDWDDGWYDDGPDDWDGDPAPRYRDSRERSRRGNPSVSQPAWKPSRKSPWAPPPSVMEFEMDYDSFWRENPAERERRERDSREIWY